ncbi:GNAT family N-acetyltransferase [Hymenobacter sp. J193]|uniref:GNAT family N-acetyltransferase n=1 Tax=Hymenobacter sp. J193 TaxID=2898429 RepID=UPI0021519D56|nr:GNAT family N-acetyltransferase [Hymenobacter sp. J193]MCR5887256.1 GNAT family N-acetyltransferase [Hymenobacter sp. J193]
MHTLVLPARRLTLSDERWAAGLLADAYVQDPLYGAVPGELGHPNYYLRLLVRYALRTGCVYASPSGQAVAVWLPAEAAGLSWAQVVKAGQLALPLGVGWSRFWQLVGWQHQQDEMRRRVLPLPHHYLLALGVRPARQHQGEGRALLRASLAALGARYAPCYASVHTLAAVHFGQRLGFGVASYGELTTTKAAVPCWGLIRPAGPV